MTQLTRREKQVVLLLGSGLAPKEIAVRLNTRPATVRQQIYQAKRKANCRTVIELAVRVSRELEHKQSTD